MVEYSIVIPVYNSGKTLPILMEEINEVMAVHKGQYEVIFVDDCSPDNSWEVLKSLRAKNDHIQILRLANNVGQWMGTLAGVSKSKGKAIITIDDDLEYDTKDLLKLIDAYHNSDLYLVYGIPHEKKNKNLSYKLFFRFRDRLLRLFFNKMQTESLKIFKREIYFDVHDDLYSNTHFEAYTKFVVSEKYIGHVPVNYRTRHSGNSNHTLWMKIRLIMKYGIEYYKAPFRVPLYFVLLFTLFGFVSWQIGLGDIVMRTVLFIIAMNVLFIIGISGNYLSSLYFKIKGIPIYVIIEEH